MTEDSIVDVGEVERLGRVFERPRMNLPVQIVENMKEQEWIKEMETIDDQSIMLHRRIQWFPRVKEIVSKKCGVKMLLEFTAKCTP